MNLPVLWLLQQRAVSQPIKMIAFFYTNKRTFVQAPRPYKGYYEICLISLRSVFTNIKCISEQSWWHSIIKDVPTQKEIWSLANKNIRAGRDWRGWEFENFLTERKHGTVIFLTLRQCTAASTKPDFCFLLSLNVKNNTVQVWFDYNWWNPSVIYGYIYLKNFLQCI